MNWMSNKFKDKMKSVGLGDLIKQIWYRLDWRKPNMVSVNEFLQDQIIWCVANHWKLPKFKSKSNDKLIEEITQWVKDNITYEEDFKRFKVVEKWQTCLETLTYRKGDCEDGAVLIYCLAIVNGISPVEINVTTGYILNNIGHCYNKYVSDEEIIKPVKDWTTKIIDWCFSGEYNTEWWSVTHL